MVIADHTARLGYFEVQFNYFTIRWDRADSSAAAARAGYGNGAGTSDELPGSGTFDALVDGGAQPLQVLRRYTLIIYPSAPGSSPAPGDVFRIAAPHEARAIIQIEEPSAQRSLSPMSPPQVAETRLDQSAEQAAQPLSRATPQHARDALFTMGLTEDGLMGEGQTPALDWHPAPAF